MGAWLAAAPSSAQPTVLSQAPPPRIEVRVAGVLGPATTGGTVTSTFAPSLVNGTGTGRSSQTLAVDSDRAVGFEGGVRIRFAARAGIEVGGSRTTAALSGTNGPVALSLQYTAMQPPDYVPRTYQVNSQVAAPPTDGHRSDTALMAGVFLSSDGADRPIGVSVSAGIRLTRLGGTIRSLTYTEYRLGGHSVLFPTQHQVEIEPVSEWTMGPYLAGELRLRLAPRVGLFGGARVMPGAGTLTRGGRVVRVLDPEASTFPPEAATAAIAMASPAIELRAASWHIYAGIVLVVK